MKEKFNTLKERYAEIADIKSAIEVLHWDQEIYMPEGGSSQRANSISALEGISHSKFTSDETGTLIKELYDWSKEKDYDSFEASYLRNIKRDYEQAKKLPTEFVTEFSKEVSLSLQAWTKAKKESDFRLFAPQLEKMVDLNIKKAEILGYKESPYDALLDLYEPGLKKSDIEPIFKELSDGLKPVIKAINSKTDKVNNDILNRDFDENKQIRLADEIVRNLGYDFNRGRQDKSAHPFTLVFSINDARITTKVQKNYLPMALYASIHECGHALYAQGMNKELERTPLSDGASLGLHESQSRFWENIIGRSQSFSKWLLPKLQNYFPQQFKNVSAEELYLAVNKSAASFIRVKADEVTYNLHILLRFEMETLLLERKIKVEDAPAVWNQKMKEYFQIVPKNDSEGILQDIHWADGSFGYFPTYALGNLISAQIFSKMAADIPDINSKIEHGEFSILLDWLRNNIHKHGRKYQPKELLKKALNDEIRVAPFIEYIKDKYSKIYGF